MVAFANVLLVYAFFWSLDETHQITLRVSNGHVSATIDGDSSQLKGVVNGQWVGLQASDYASYRIQATGEAIQADTGSIFGRVAETFRLAQPGSAWTNLRIHLPGGRSTSPPLARSYLPANSWTLDRRGEWQGAPGSYALFGPVFAPTYTLSVEAIRPDGTQSVLLGVNGSGAGYALQLRFDQPDAIWLSWSNGAYLSGAGGTPLHRLPLTPELQRVVRTVLTPYLYALVLIAMAYGCFALLATVFGRIRVPDTRLSTPLLGRHRVGLTVLSVLGIVTIGVTETSMVSTFLLDRIPHVQDSVAYLFQARIFAGGTFHAPAPPIAIRSFFIEQFVPFYRDHWFSQYPPGHPLILALGVLTGAPWLVEPVVASFALACVFLLGRQVYGASVGLMAAFLGLASPFWLYLGSSFMSHATGLFFVAACLLCFVMAEDTADGRWAAAAGFFAGMALLTRQATALGALGPLLVFTLFFGKRSRGKYLGAALGFAVPVAFLLLYNDVQMGDPFQSTYAAWDPRWLFGFGPHGQPGPASGDPFTPGDGVWNDYQNLAMLSAQLFGWPYAVTLAPAAIPFVTGRARRFDWLLLSSFAGLVFVHTFYWSAGLMYGPRYYYEALPSLLLLTARGIEELYRLPSESSLPFLPSGRPGLRVLLPAVLVGGLFWFSFAFYEPPQLALYRKYNYSSDAELMAVSRRGIHHAIVFVVTTPPGFWAPYGNVFFANDPQLKGNVIYVRDQGSLDPVLYPYFPGRSHYRLDGTRLTALK